MRLQSGESDYILTVTAWSYEVKEQVRKDAEDERAVALKMKGLAGSIVSRCMGRLFIFEELSMIHTAIFKLRVEYATLAAELRTLKTKASLQYWMDDSLNYLHKVLSDMDWTVNKRKRIQIKVDLELMEEIIRQLLLLANAMSRLFELDGRDALSPDPKEKLDVLDAFPEFDVSSDVLRTMLREKPNSAEGQLRVVRKKRKR